MPRTKTFDENQVLQHAMELFWKKGFHATSIQDLVQHLGINRASLYDTFGGKEALFDKAFALYRQSNTTQLKAFLAQQSSVKEGLQAMFDMGIDQASQDAEKKGCFVVNTTTERIPGEKALQQVLIQNREHFEQLFYEYLQKGVTQGEIAPDKDLKALAKLLFTLYNGISVVVKTQANPQEMKHMMRVTLALLD